MATKAVVKALKKQMTPDMISHLSSVVDDAASQMATAANKEGVEGQIDFLIDTCGYTPEMILQQI